MSQNSGGSSGPGESPEEEEARLNKKAKQINAGFAQGQITLGEAIEAHADVAERRRTPKPNK